MLFIITILQCLKGYKKRWVAYSSSHKQKLLHRVELTCSQPWSSSMLEPGVDQGLHYPSPPISSSEFVNVHKNKCASKRP